MITFGSLFAGIGGFDLGFERAKMRCSWQVEIDNKCNKVLAHHWPDVQRYGDIKDVGRRNLESVDLICGGFPCQGLSVAGRRAGLADERSGLWWEFYRIIDELRPQWVVIENVPGLLSSWSPTEPPPSGVCAGARWEVEEASDLETILASLAELSYEWAYRIFDAQYDRVAQRRRRVFIVGHTRDMGRLEPAVSRQNVSRLASLPVKVLFESSSVCWDTAPSRRAGEKPAYALAASVRGTGDGHGQGWNSNYIVKHALSGHNQRNDPDGEHFVIARPLAFGSTSNHYDESQQTYVPVWNWQSGGDVRFSFGKPNLQVSQVPAVGVRRLTPTECERLQGFPDGWTAVNGMKDTARYRLLGNAVCVPVAEWLGRRLLWRGDRRQEDRNVQTPESCFSKQSQ